MRYTMRDSLERVREGERGARVLLNRRHREMMGLGSGYRGMAVHTWAHSTGTTITPKSNHNKNHKNLGSEIWQLRYPDG